jgi:RHH-type proline utilization regulon transcriptional repressor/proline dehydrogenase/delta 1-pyrroline-5-carboxylate dehydrogenase
MVKNSLETLLKEISIAYCPEEKTSVSALLKQASTINAQYEDDFAYAKKLIENTRVSSKNTPIEDFINTYNLSTSEGVIIMCLAEALLRIPDAKTADALIKDRLKSADWDAHLGKSNSLFVNASTWGLMLTGNMVSLKDQTQKSVSSLVKKMVSSASEPVIRQAFKTAMGIVGNQFVMGETIEEAFQKSAKLRKQGFTCSYDMLGEGARSEVQAKNYLESYKKAIITAGKHTKDDKPIMERSGISVKLSALYPRYENLQHDNVQAVLFPRILSLLQTAKEVGVPITIDAEEAKRLDISLLLFKRLCEHPSLENYDGLGFVIQAYQKRALKVVEFIAALAKATKRKIPVRLVKGAYWDSEIKEAQMEGIEGYPVFTRKSYTDVSYLVCAQEMFEQSEYIYPQFATHNALSIASIHHLAKDKPYELQRLHGMGKDFYSDLVKDVPCRVYAPVGHHKDLLAYLIRRLLENGANNSFVNMLTQDIPLRTMLANPVEKAKSRKGLPHPKIPPPANIYDERKNAAGINLGSLTIQRELEATLKEQAVSWEAAPIVGTLPPEATTSAVCSPHQKDQIVGHVANAKRKMVDKAVTTAREGFKKWKHVPVEERAAILEKAALDLEENPIPALSLCMREAGKTIDDCIAEVREAVDFLRYYALKARHHFEENPLVGYTGESNTLTHHPRGVFVAISPWNFPLAIFTGQVAAALVCGNSVIAKPAEQTPLVAHYLTTLLHDAGVPKDALIYLPGKGDTIGAKLTKHEGIDGVVFTGSVTTAKAIGATLAQRKGSIVPFIAETGGQNAMIVDSTSLPEQVVDDILTSAFSSAGQRCSALRVLYLQEDIAKVILPLLKDALHTKVVGNPEMFNTDIGPVIDDAARKSLKAHIQRMKRKATLLAAQKVPSYWQKRGSFISPHIFEIGSISELTEEQFGPILHVVRYKASKLENVLDEINNTGYGLTLGIHSRIQERAEYIRSRVNVGNVYVNRSQIGAVVGMQPFGGEGLSGTGPKAGGPHYLGAFTTERTYTVNTVAIGGNVDLLS